MVAGYAPECELAGTHIQSMVAGYAPGREKADSHIQHGVAAYVARPEPGGMHPMEELANVRRAVYLSAIGRGKMNVR